MKYRFIAAEKADYPVVVLCRVMNVSRSAYYAWLNREPDVERLRLIFIVVQIFERSRGTYGARRVSKALKAEGIEAGRTMASKLMEEARIEARRKKRYKVTTDSGHALPVAPNLLERRFDVEETDRVWTGDITFLLTRQGWAYLAVVLDLASRMVVGWALSTRIDRRLVTDALRSAFRKRLPEEGLLFHSDRGSQYASFEFTELLRRCRITQSMSRKGNCWDNAVTERFFRTLKEELTDGRSYESVEDLRRDLFDYIEVFYNRERLHSTLGYLSPAVYESRMFVR